MRGSFVSPEGKVLFYGERADGALLEKENTFIEGLAPATAFEMYDEYYWINGEWVLQKDINKPDPQVVMADALKEENQSPFGRIALRAIFELAKQSNPTLTKAQYRKHLKTLL